jgi:hypothetical protein
MSALLSWAGLVFQLLAVWLVFCSGRVSHDRLKIYILIGELPLRVQQGPIWEALLAVSYRRHMFYRLFLLDPDPLFQQVYAVIEWQIARESLRLDVLRRRWIDHVAATAQT